MPLRADTFRKLTRPNSTLLSLSGFRLLFLPYQEAAVHIHVIDSLIYNKPQERFALQRINQNIRVLKVYGPGT